jgi:hypothetical protein
MAVGAGGAFTGGVKRLPPVGLMDFSVGAGGAVADVGADVVVVVVVVSGAFGSSFAHEAVKPTIVTTAAPPISAATRRANRLIIRPIFPTSAGHQDLSGERNSIPSFYQAHSDCAGAAQPTVELRRFRLPGDVAHIAVPARWWSPCTNRFSIR